MALTGKPKYLVVYGSGAPGPDGCPCPYEVAAQVHMVLRKARQAASSVYRGSDAVAILHAHGKHTQAEIHVLFPDISNPEGESEHDLHSDGVGNAGPVGRRLAPWQVGVDSGTNDQASKDRVTRAARAFGWNVSHPYQRGVEGHHWCFRSPPRPRNPWQRARIAFWRRTLPTK